jgi:hypothetical protein
MISALRSNDALAVHRFRSSALLLCAGFAAVAVCGLRAMSPLRRMNHCSRRPCCRGSHLNRSMNPFCLSVFTRQERGCAQVSRRLLVLQPLPFRIPCSRCLCLQQSMTLMHGRRCPPFLQQPPRPLFPLVCTTQSMPSVQERRRTCLLSWVQEAPRALPSLVRATRSIPPKLMGLR